jgi:hypothetical protein
MPKGGQNFAPPHKSTSDSQHGNLRVYISHEVLFHMYRIKEIILKLKNRVNICL